MTPTTTSPPLPAIPDDVRAFAAARGAADYLEPLLDLARQCFAGAPLSIFLEEDLEITDRWFIVIDVDVTDWDTDRFMAAYDRWSMAKVAMCPPDLREYFLLGW